MCGLIGSLGPKANLYLSSLQNSMGLLEHRGPDGLGHAEGDHFLLSHCRLAISGGEINAQPVKSVSGNSSLAFNGQIYNASALARAYELPLGRDRWDADALVLVELIDLLGAKALGLLDGVFSGAWIDHRAKSGYLFSDQFGTRPLYYWSDKSAFCFASEVEALRSLSKYNLKLNTDAFLQYIAFFTPVNSSTWFEDVHIIEPGEIVQIDLQTLRISKNQYNKPRVQALDQCHSDPLENQIQLREIFNSACLGQVPNSLPFNFLLSSGVDSSLIASALSSLPNSRGGISVWYPQDSTSKFDESFDVREFAQTIGANLTLVPVTSEIFYDQIGTALTALEEPRVGQSVINFLAFREASRSCKVTYSGTGADELFGGYPWRYPIEIGTDGATPVTLTPDEINRSILRSWSRVIPAEDWEIALSGSLASNVADVAAVEIARITKSHERDLSGWNSTRAIMDFERHTFLRALLLVDDRMSMHNSLEVRVPFLSKAMVEFADNLPVSQLFEVNPVTNQLIGKVPLREILGLKHHANVARRPKKGFSAPDANWFRDESNFLLRSLYQRNQPIWDLINVDYGRDVMKQHLAGVDKRASIWGFISINHLLSKF